MQINSLKWLVTVAIIGALAAVGVLVAYILQFGSGGVSGDPRHWGMFGDYLGGVLGGALAFLSLLALLFTIYIQSAELSATREELHASSTAQAESAKYSRLEASLRLREHYIQLMAQKGELLKGLQGMEGGTRAESSLAELDSKLREINEVIYSFHESVVSADV